MEKRKKMAIWIISGLVILSVIAFFLRDESFEDLEAQTWEEETIEVGGPEKIVQIYIDGVIQEDTESDPAFGYSFLMDQLDQVMEDEMVKAIVLRINTPGGSVVASDEIYEKLLELKQKGKKVIVSMGSTAASGGYYISAPADKIYANRATLTGSLGVIFSFYNFSELADKYGVSEVVIKSGRYKDIGSPLRAMVPEEKEIFQKLVDESYQRFVDIIAEGRKLPREKVLELADGRVYSGLQAESLGLVDQLGDLEEATQGAKELSGYMNASVIRYQEPFAIDSLFGDFLGFKSQKMDLLGIKQAISPDQAPQLQYLFRP